MVEGRLMRLVGIEFCLVVTGFCAERISVLSNHIADSIVVVRFMLVHLIVAVSSAFIVHESRPVFDKFAAIVELIEVGRYSASRLWSHLDGCAAKVLSVRGHRWVKVIGKVIAS